MPQEKRAEMEKIGGEAEQDGPSRRAIGRAFPFEGKKHRNWRRCDCAIARAVELRSEMARGIGRNGRNWRRRQCGDGGDGPEESLLGLECPLCPL